MTEDEIYVVAEGVLATLKASGGDPLDHMKVLELIVARFCASVSISDPPMQLKVADAINGHVKGILASLHAQMGEPGRMLQ
jgi:hypothetical protein